VQNHARRWGGIVALLLLVVPKAGEASNNERACGCYALTAWPAEAGLMGTVFAMTQDRDGYLWLGTSEGLVRFDGHDFTRWEDTGGAPLPGGSISALMTASDGSLWAAFDDVAGVARIRVSTVTYFNGEGVPRRSITALIEDSDGAIFAAGTGGLAVFRDEVWHPVGPPAGLPVSEITSLFRDRNDGIWVGTSVGIFHRPSRHQRFEPHTNTTKFVQSFTQDALGQIWITDMQRFVKRLDNGQVPRFASDIRLPGNGWRMLTDNHGTIWITALGGGLFTLKPSVEQVERVKYEREFPGENTGGPWSVFQDRTGNIWVGTRSGGLLRIRYTPIDNHISLEGLTFDGVRALAGMADGTAWVGTSYNLIRFDRSKRTVYDFQQTMALHADRDGHLWAATEWGIGRFDNGKLIPISVPSWLRLERVSSLAVAPDGAVWICSIEQGIYRWYRNRLDDFADEELRGVAGRRCGVVHAEPTGRIWIGYSAGGVATYTDGRFQLFSADDGLTPGAITAIYQDSHGRIWISSVNGLSRFDNGTFKTLTREQGFPSRIVPSLLEDDAGQMWLGVESGAGMIRFSPDDFDRAVGGGTQLRYALYDASDGLAGTSLRVSRPSAVTAGGRFWLASRNGVSTFDPDSLPREWPQPISTITRVTIDDREVSADSGIAVPHDASTLSIDYAALDLSHASKLRFRYMLEGFDSDWIAAGNSHSARYTNLRPGEYRFRIGATSTGEWIAPDTVWRFTVKPPFYQTIWFLVSCVVAFVLLISSVWLARMRTIRKEFALVVAERARVSRDLHDTLLQSLAAVGMELEALANGTGPASGDSMRPSLRALRQQVARCVVEARRSTNELRLPRLEVEDLIEDLRQFADDVTLGSSSTVEVVVSGRHRRSTPEVNEQLLRIGLEAISNAVRHSGADKVLVELTYSREAVALRVSDTGRGFDKEPERSSTHWGIRNMRDRAARISATFRITSRPGAGTVVETIVTR
jgi:signal transduction histidine kinase/ligand-binding sensor domain-containing protein